MYQQANRKRSENPGTSGLQEMMMMCSDSSEDNSPPEISSRKRSENPGTSGLQEMMMMCVDSSEDNSPPEISSIGQEDLDDLNMTHPMCLMHTEDRTLINRKDLLKYFREFNSNNEPNHEEDYCPPTKRRKYK